MPFVVMLCLYQICFCFYYVKANKTQEVIYFLNFILLASPRNVIKQRNKEKVAGIPKQCEPVKAGPEN